MRLEKVTGILLGLIWCMASLVHGADLAGTKPNIILVITDDQGYGPVGRHGHPWIQTPNMDKLYDQSTRFTRFLVAPTCAPTRSAMMTGRHPMRNGVTHTILERERMTLAATTLPQVLKQAGYTSGIFGKWHLGDEDEYQPHNRGFDEAFIHGAGGIGQAYDCSCADAPGNKYFDPYLKHNGAFVKTTGYCTDLFFTAALGWVKQVKDGDAPFFAYIATNAPHAPFIAPPENEKRFLELGFKQSEAGFYGMIENIDENLGRLLAKVDEWNLTRETVIIFMSDNGMTGGGSGRLGQPIGKTAEGKVLYPYNAGMKGLKGSVDEGGVRVPFFIRWSGQIEPGRDIDTVAAHMDLFPTLVGLAGGKLPPGQVEGRSLLPLIHNPQSEWPPRLLVSHKGRWKTGVDPNEHKLRDFAVRGPRFRLVGTDQLYDMLNDPGQTTNVAAQHPDVVQRMLKAYDEWWTGTVPLMVNEAAEMLPYRPFHVQFEKQSQSTGIPPWTAPQL